MDLFSRCRYALLIAGIASAGAMAGHGAAQTQGSIRGKVVELGSRRPLAGVQIAIPALKRGGVTNAAGEFLILGLSPGVHRVRTHLLGYRDVDRDVTVAAGVAEADFELSQSAVALDEIVVTGTPGGAMKRTLGNSITTVAAADVVSRTNVSTMTELLQGRSPGVQILPNSGIPGAAADIRIRGASSLTGGEPVVFVDGVRFSTADLGSFTPSGAGTNSFSGQRTSAFDFINPRDIESIEIIKGPAAATLYGAEAANGVIQIITKKGARGEQKIQWTARLEQGTNEWGTRIPMNYTTCNFARVNERDSGGNPVWPGCQEVALGTVLTGRPLRDDPLALRDGSSRKVSLAMRGGGDRYSFYVAGDQDLNEGVFHNSYNQRRSVRTNFVLSPSQTVDVTLNTAYSQNHLRLPVGDEASQGMLLSAFRGRPGRVTTDPLNAGWGTTRAEQANGYNNQTESDRLTVGTTVNVNPLSWFRNRLTLGLDYTSSLAEVLSPAGSTDADFAGVREGSVAQRMPRNYVYSLDYAGNVRGAVTDDLESTTSFGFQAVSKRYQSLFARGTGFGAPDVTLIGNAQSQTGSNDFTEQKSLGLYVQEQIGWRNRLFLTGAVRADDNSAFGERFDWLYYPKLSASWVISEEPALGELLEAMRLNNLRFRAAYGHAGQSPTPFAATQTYTVDKVATSSTVITSALRARSLGNPSLVAERGEEYELGFEAGLFDERLALEVTYYDKRMKDVIVSTSAPGSTGFGNTFFGTALSVFKNLGSTRNSGVEVGLNATPVQTRAISWDSRATLSTNRNEMVTFGDARLREPISGQSFLAVQEHRVGYPLGAYWVRPPMRNADGSLLLNAGAAVLDTAVYVGTSIPTREVSFSNTFTLFRDFQLYLLLDHKGGHRLFNYKEFARCTVASQLNCARMNDAALANDPEMPFWRTPYAYVEKADFVKLRDLSLTYSIPTTWARRFQATRASVTVAGHNLALWSDYSGMDPEVNGYGTRAFARSDIYPVPMMRRLSAALDLSF